MYTTMSSANAGLEDAVESIRFTRNLVEDTYQNALASVGALRSRRVTKPYPHEFKNHSGLAARQICRT